MISLIEMVTFLKNLCCRKKGQNETDEIEEKKHDPQTIKAHNDGIFDEVSRDHGVGGGVYSGLGLKMKSKRAGKGVNYVSSWDKKGLKSIVVDKIPEDPLEPKEALVRKRRPKRPVNSENVSF